MLDGYDDEDKGSLHDRPDLQEKVRRVITQGHIDPEDWRGVSLTWVTSSLLLMLMIRTQR